MKHFVSAVGGCLIATLFTGCIVVGVDRKDKPTEVVVVHHSPDAVTVAEIDAAAKLSFAHARASALNTIAARPGLSPAAQVHLVNTAFKHLSFAHDQVAVLSTLINNPGFANPAKHTLLTKLNQISFDHDRAHLLNLINQRGELKE